ncbi:3-oxoacid CoA-transferase subunit B [Acinetobacter gerneri]|uniref:3-oxoadipate CoA-transferase subunit B n=1 Tax=Acinetobacter gerneri DSM 14967 = CIP 107464 = MTCC 9824 TaxID=1120926 RepID=N8YAS9_9GAMM|nr:3-oxoacid CoA-transferase subunit B [Acinetobacter gerneri]ENV33746.1 3-oxoadipate CoA-transferase subunit B [Acinetobacter gerneri DSM 14967 = CIP 107464 = MTCC 9824]EPR82249.1 3-oxoadipate CoA-transferase subunit B [Acinetobacter gerneri DSM 14967 = CIP 107464 = MTCC 9824]
MSYQKMTREQIAKRIAEDIPDGAYVNLGIGLPTQIANYLPEDREIILHSENGILAFGAAPIEGQEDLELINAGKEFVTMQTGGSFFHHGDSFAMMRGGHLDICVLGAFQVAENGDLANWHTGNPDAIPAVGGAMDLAVGAKKVFIATEHLTRQGQSKIVSELSYPVTGKNCVDRIYTDLCVIDVTADGLAVREIVSGLTFEALQSLTDAKLIDLTKNQ